LFSDYYQFFTFHFRSLVNTRLANILSAVLHPLLMPTMASAILFYWASPAFQLLDTINESSNVHILGVSLSVKAGLLLLIFNFTYLIPVYLIYVLYRFGSLKSLKMETLAERRQPYLLTTIVYTLVTLFFAFKVVQVPELTVLQGAITFAVAMVGYISLYWQISAHATGIGGVVGTILIMAFKFGIPTLLYPTLWCILLAGWLCAARLHLNAHTTDQIGAGFSLGFLSSVLCIGFLL
jgi:hypothetical protein